MKKILLSLIVILCVFALVGCKKDKEVTEMKAGVIELEGNPTTGYEWTCTIENEEVAKVEAIYEPDETTSAMTGVGGTYLFTVTGQKEGTATIICKYSRSWEENETDEVKTYNVTINKDLDVTIEEK